MALNFWAAAKWHPIRWANVRKAAVLRSASINQIIARLAPPLPLALVGRQMAREVIGPCANLGTAGSSTILVALSRGKSPQCSHLFLVLQLLALFQLPSIFLKLRNLCKRWKEYLLFVLAPFVLEPNANDSRIQASHFHQLLFGDSVGTLVLVVGLLQDFQLTLVQHSSHPLCLHWLVLFSSSHFLPVYPFCSSSSLALALPMNPSCWSSLSPSRGFVGCRRQHWPLTGQKWQRQCHGKPLRPENGQPMRQCLSVLMRLWRRESANLRGLRRKGAMHPRKRPTDNFVVGAERAGDGQMQIVVGQSMLAAVWHRHSHSAGHWGWPRMSTRKENCRRSMPRGPSREEAESLVASLAVAKLGIEH